MPIAPDAAPSREGAPAVGAAAFDGDWPALVRTLKVAGLAKQLADRSELVGHIAGRFELRLPASSKHLADRAYVDKLKAALVERLGGPVSISVALGEVAGRTVAAQEEGVRRGRLEEAEATVHADAFVRDLVENFDATIDSIKPVQ
jgi:DNA polymerase-3 subunit gamma/tau